MIAPPKNHQRTMDESTISQSAENRRSITARALLLLLRVYQTYLSPMNFSACRFYPSCSHYAGEAVQRFGARRGVWLALCRLARCQPFSRGGFDPVPDAPSSSHTSTHLMNDETQIDAVHHSAHYRQVDDLYQGTASAVPYSASNSGALAAATRATRGQELAQ
jgi:putative membrane protein insertion efficiency factor